MKTNRTHTRSFLYVQAIATADAESPTSFRHTVITAPNESSAYALGQAWSDANPVDAQLLNDFVVGL